MSFEDKYNAHESEQKIREFWQENKIYEFDENTSKITFSIDTPPPTLSGRMHIGHAFSYTQTDFVARYKRMSGFEVFYNSPGALWRLREFLKRPKKSPFGADLGQYLSSEPRSTVKRKHSQSLIAWMHFWGGPGDSKRKKWKNGPPKSWIFSMKAPVTPGKHTSRHGPPNENRRELEEK